MMKNTVTTARGREMGLKGIAVALMTVMLLVPAGLAQESRLSEIKSGVTPDNPLYIIDSIFDDASLFLTFDDSARARRSIEIAHKRLLGTENMILNGRLDLADITKKDYEKVAGVSRSSLKNIRLQDKARELETEIELQKEIEQHDAEVQRVAGEIGVRSRIVDSTQEQRDKIDSILNSMKDKSREIRTEVEVERDETKTELKNQAGEDAVKVEIEIENRVGIAETKRERAESEILDAKRELERLKKDVSETDDSGVRSSALRLQGESESHLNDAINSFDSDDFGEAFGHARSAREISESGGRQLTKSSDSLKDMADNRELNIEMSVFDDVSSVKVEKGGAKLRFMADTADRTKVISEIEKRTGLIPVDIAKVMKIKFEDSSSHPEDRFVEIEIEVEREHRQELEREREREREGSTTTLRSQVLTSVSRGPILIIGSNSGSGSINSGSGSVNSGPGSVNSGRENEQRRGEDDLFSVTSTSLRGSITSSTMGSVTSSTMNDVSGRDAEGEGPRGEGESGRSDSGSSGRASEGELPRGSD